MCIVAGGTVTLASLRNARRRPTEFGSRAIQRQIAFSICLLHREQGAVGVCKFLQTHARDRLFLLLAHAQRAKIGWFVVRNAVSTVHNAAASAAAGTRTTLDTRTIIRHNGLESTLTCAIDVTWQTPTLITTMARRH